MSDALYKRQQSTVLRPASRGVVIQPSGGAYFRCPCDERAVHLSPKTHGIRIEHNAVGALRETLTVKGSVKSEGYYFDKSGKSRAMGFCHFWITDGVPEMHDDATCPGGAD